MKTCSKCNAQIDDIETVCPKCGESLTQKDISNDISQSLKQLTELHE